MVQVNLYKIDGKSVGKIDLPDALFAVKIKSSLIHEVIVAQDANSRVRLAQVKDRSEVRGGGRKPWKQKGTGRARHGSRRSPIWIGGGITFGPTKERNFSKKINKKVRKKALAMVLSDKVNEDWLIAVEDFNIAEAKTKLVADLRQALPGSSASALIVTTKEDKDMILAAENLPKTQTIGASSINVRDLVKHQYIIASKAALLEIQETYL